MLYGYLINNNALVYINFNITLLVLYYNSTNVLWPDLLYRMSEFAQVIQLQVQMILMIKVQLSLIASQFWIKRHRPILLILVYNTCHRPPNMSTGKYQNI